MYLPNRIGCFLRGNIELMDNRPVKNLPGFPPAQGLYTGQNEHDGCGIGFVANIKGHKSHDLIEKGLLVLKNLVHRGAQGCDPCTGDGAGILSQIPHDFFQRVAAETGIRLPSSAGAYGVGMVFLPQDPKARQQCEALFESIIQEEGQECLGWRDVPVKEDHIGVQARSTMPIIRQFFVARALLNPVQFERKLYVIRKRMTRAIGESALAGREWVYISSLSSNTIVYKGMLLPEQVSLFYPDLADPTFTSALALVHSRFSTNTFPTWSLAHPYRYTVHNGEINTL